MFILRRLRRTSREHEMIYREELYREQLQNLIDKPESTTPSSCTETLEDFYVSEGCTGLPHNAMDRLCRDIEASATRTQTQLAKIESKLLVMVDSDERL